MRRPVPLALAAVLLLAGGAVLALRLLPASFVQEHFLGQAEVPEEALHARLRAFHKGPGPCLRTAWLDTQPPEAFPEITSRLEAAGLNSVALADLAGQYVQWADEREAALHEATATEELISAVSEGKPWTALILGLNGERVRQFMQVDTTDVVAQGTAAFRALSAEQQVAVRALWEERPEAFTITNLYRQVQALREREVNDRLKALAEVVSAHLKRHPPGDDAQLDLVAIASAASLPAEDAYGEPFSLFIDRDRFRLQTRDGSTSVEVERQVPSAFPRSAPPAHCGGAPMPVTLERAVVDRAIQNPTDIALHARIVPAFLDGEVRGFKLFAIQPHSLFALVGLCDGDVVTAVNGRALTSPDQALAAYNGARHATSLRLDVTRSGTSHGVLVTIR